MDVVRRISCPKQIAASTGDACRQYVEWLSPINNVLFCHESKTLKLRLLNNNVRRIIR